MTDLNKLLKQRLLESTLVKRIPNDCLQLEDDILLAAIHQQTKLTHAQAKLMINSPMTILRFKHLYNEQQIKQKLWLGSEGLLLAAASEQDISSLSTSDHLWSLHFLSAQTGSYNLVLKCQADNNLLDHLLDTEQQLEVTDNKGNLICQGELDEEGELEAIWPFTLSPRRYFQEIGEGFKVRPKS